MLYFLYNLPNFCITLLFGLIGACLFVGPLFLRAKLLRIRVNAEQARSAHDAFAIVIGFAGLVLAFSLVQEQNTVRSLEAQVGTEANDLAQLDRLLVRFGNPGDRALRISLREYANSIVNDEWPQLRRSRVSGRTTRLLRELTQDVSAVDPAPGQQSLIYTEMLKKVDELTIVRESRLVSAITIRLAPIFWETVGFIHLILLILAALSESSFSLGGAVALGCQGFAVALLVALVFVFDRPFTGRTAISAQPIVKVIAEMQNR